MLNSAARVIPFILVAFLASQTAASADPVLNFFESVGRSISHATQKSKPRPRAKPVRTARAPARPQAATPAPTDQEPNHVEAVASAVPTATAAATPAPSPQSVLRAVAINPETHSSTRDIPYAIPVPNKAGFVTSPFAPNQGLVDVRGFRSGTAVKDPYTGKYFLTP